MPLLDYLESDLLPQNLSKEETENPIQVIHELFDFAHLPDIRTIHWELLKTAVTGSYHRELTFKERYDLVYFYERMEKLIEAVHLIHKNSQATRANNSLESTQKKNSSNLVFYQCPDELIHPLTVFIQKAKPEKVFLLSSFTDSDINLSNPLCFDLIILLPGSSDQPFESYYRIFEQFKKDVTIIPRIYKAQEVYRLLKQGHVFYSKYCMKEKLLYDDYKNELPVYEIGLNETELNIKEVLKNGFEKANDFLKGAEFFHSQNRNELAAFMLHQALELFYRALIKGHTGHDIVSHNLYRLRKYSISFCSKIKEIFPLSAKEENEEYYLLQKAYVNARYSKDFIVENEYLVKMIQIVKSWAKILVK